MVSYQKVFGGGKNIGTITGEPSDSPSANKVGTARGGNLFQDIVNRGAKAVNPDGSKTATPAAFGGAPTFVKYPNSKKVKGGGANTGAGTTSTTTDP